MDVVVFAIVPLAEVRCSYTPRSSGSMVSNSGAEVLMVAEVSLSRRPCRRVASTAKRPMTARTHGGPWSPRCSLSSGSLDRSCCDLHSGMRSTRNAVVTTLSERTPLLPGSSRRGQGSVHPGPPLGTAEELELPHIGPFVAAMRLEDIHRYTVDDLSPAILQARSYRAAFAICSLLYLRTYLKESFPRGRDIWVQWSQEKRGTNAARGVETLVKQVWAHFVSEEGSPEEVEQVLWTAFPLYPDSSLSVRGGFTFLCRTSVLHGPLQWWTSL